MELYSGNLHLCSEKKSLPFGLARKDPYYKTEVATMLAKCANPTCSTPLVYLREGKIFMVEVPPQAQKSSEERLVTMPKAANRVEHFWLCGPCSAQMTLAYDRQHGVQVVPKSPLALRAAAS